MIKGAFHFSILYKVYSKASIKRIVEHVRVWRFPTALWIYNIKSLDYLLRDFQLDNISST